MSVFRTKSVCDNNLRIYDASPVAFQTTSEKYQFEKFAELPRIYLIMTCS